MVRCANRFRTTASIFKGSTPCGTHHCPGGSLHAPYGLARNVAIGNVANNKIATVAGMSDPPWTADCSGNRAMLPARFFSAGSGVSSVNHDVAEIYGRGNWLMSPGHSIPGPAAWYNSQAGISHHPCHEGNIMS